MVSIQMGSLRFLLFFVILALYGIHGGLAGYTYATKWLEVPVDHFGFANNDTFKMRYLKNDSFAFEPDTAAILFYAGNEGDIELFAQNTGFMWDAVMDRSNGLNAELIFAEHRYYGKSLPYGNKSYDSAKQLGYLSSEQALADFASLLQEINKDNRRPVIAIGGSYGGMLAAWFRMKYPHMVLGAIAASAPILQFTDITPCEVYNRILTSVYATAYSKDCSDNIRKSWAVLKSRAETEDGRAFLTRKFNLCANLTKQDDIKDLKDYLTDMYSNLAMANYPYPANFLAPLPAYPVREFCWRLKGGNLNDTQLLEYLASAVSVYANYTGKVPCLNVKQSTTNSLDTRGWDFQSCTEMVMPMCSNGKDDMFEPEKWDYKKFSDDCFQRLGVRPRSEIEMVTRYGGNQIETATNIVFSNGLLDPWSGAGVLRTPNSRIKIVIIPEGAHHIDLRAKDPKDPQSVTVARQMHLSTIKEWISQRYSA
ncbi:lysosomal Pro-X carboxypeptidase [Phlebotomus argentipes]|uniref:lysosomal Pro-X carboxypeptidase n=1 Tax=Phlebotomus argentipes TaxID=94469 RepID=UPI0028936457|nr:lysosomal Pro-X carboxypeptidase [Phlebotomus argentipes]